jgi:hypothetical protein
VNITTWRKRNNLKRVKVRLLHPWPIYRRVGGINAVVNRADGSTENLGRISDTFAKRWGVGTR